MFDVFFYGTCFRRQSGNVKFPGFEIGNGKFFIVEHISAYAAHNKFIDFLKHFTLGIYGTFVTLIVDINFTVFKNDAVLIRFRVLPIKKIWAFEHHFSGDYRRPKTFIN